MSRVFLLSPAHSGGKRAAMLTRPAASFELARQVQIGAATLGDVFAFCSGLYFRGKLSYARHFAAPSVEAWIITPSRGLVLADTFVGTRDLAEFAEVAVDSAEPRFTGPLKATALELAAAGTYEVVLLGSVATGKYIDTLLPIFGARLLFPAEFAGRGDMSRGALLLRAVAAQSELGYVPVVPVRRKGRKARLSDRRARTVSRVGRGAGSLSPHPPNFARITPTTRPPTAPTPRMGIGILVMIAGGRLSKIPIVRPMSQPEHGISIRQTTNPIANRLKNAPARAAVLSGKDIGNIIATVSRPNPRPHTFASMNRDMPSSTDSRRSPTSRNATGCGNRRRARYPQGPPAMIYAVRLYRVSEGAPGRSGRQRTSRGALPTERWRSVSGHLRLRRLRRHRTSTRQSPLDCHNDITALT